MRNVVLVVAAAAVLTACAKKPDAMSVCKKLEAAGVGSKCRAAQAAGLGSAARERVDLDLAAPAGEIGQVLSFDKSSDYDATVKAFDAAAALVGRHRYGSSSALILVQLNSGAPQEVGDKAKGVVGGL